MSNLEDSSFAGPLVTEEYIQDTVGDFKNNLNEFYVDEPSVLGKYQEVYSNNYTSEYPVSPSYLGVNCGLEGCPFALSSLLPPLLPSTENLSVEEDGVAGDSAGGDDNHGTTGLWIMVVLMSFLIVVTIVGNILVCLSVILVRKLRKPQNYLLVSLAISDLFVALLVMPFAIVIEFHNSYWPLNDSLCDLWVSGKNYEHLTHLPIHFVRKIRMVPV